MSDLEPFNPDVHCWDCGCRPIWEHSYVHHCKECHRKNGHPTTEEIDIDELEGLRSQVERLKALLAKIEFVLGNSANYTCPACGGYQTYGHEPDCELARELGNP